jgi:HEPN domain-containing protein
MDKPEVVMPVFSWDHRHLTRVERWFAEAQAAVRTAVFLFESMAQELFVREYFRAKMAAFNFSHGVELFLKGAIAHARVHVDHTHDLKQLYATYANRYQGKRFAFSESMQEFVTEDPEKPNTQFLRYPERDAATPWRGNNHFDIALWHYEVATFATNMPRLINEVLAREVTAA